MTIYRAFSVVVLAREEALDHSIRLKSTPLLLDFSGEMRDDLYEEFGGHKPSTELMFQEIVKQAERDVRSGAEASARRSSRRLVPKLVPDIKLVKVVLRSQRSQKLISEPETKVQ
uniref:Uncharacterized protein n=1 Tax=Steinernema glaseri TaxID=37863 RepID=A0A1I7YPX3_9BILA